MLKQDEEPTSSEGDESQEEDEEGEEGDEEDVVEEESGVPPSGMFPKVDIDAGLYSALKDQFMRWPPRPPPPGHQLTARAAYKLVRRVQIAAA